MRSRNLLIVLAGLFCLSLPQIANAGLWSIINPAVSTPPLEFDDDAEIDVNGKGNLNWTAVIKMFRKTATGWSEVKVLEKVVGGDLKWDVKFTPNPKWQVEGASNEYKFELWRKIGENDPVDTGQEVVIIINKPGLPV